MLDAYIIDVIKKEELERARREEEARRLRLEIPMPRREIEQDDISESQDPIVIPLTPEIPLTGDETEDAA